MGNKIEENKEKNYKITAKVCKDCQKNCYCWAGIALLNNKIYPKAKSIIFDKPFCHDVIY